MTVSHRKNKIQARSDDRQPAFEPGIRYHCDACGDDITLTVRVRCAGGCDNFDLCGSCFCSGAEVKLHKPWHDYRIVEQHAYPIFCNDWGADEELLLIDGCQIYGVGNWADIADHIGNRTKEDVERHYISVFLEGKDGTEEGEKRAQAVLELREKERAEAVQASLERGRRSPTPIVGPNEDFEPTISVDEFQVRKRRRIEGLRKAQANFQPPKLTKPLVSAPTSHSEIAGFMPGRLEFDLEYEQDAENLTKDMEFGRVYKYGGDLIKSEHDALGGQKAVQGQARMPPSARGAVGSRSGTGAAQGATKGTDGADDDDEEAGEVTQQLLNGSRSKRAKDDDDDDEADEHVKQESEAPPEKDVDMAAPDATNASKTAQSNSQAANASAPAGTATATASTSASAAAGPSSSAAPAPGAEVDTAAPEDKAADWDEDDLDLELKLVVLDMYNERLDRRGRKKEFMFQRNLVDYKRNTASERRRPKEERELLNRVRHFAQLQTAQDFEDFLNGLCHEEALRRTALQLQRWRKVGITSLQDGVVYEKEKTERQKKAAAIAEGGLAAFPHVAIATGPRQSMSKAAAAARQRETSVFSQSGKDDNSDVAATPTATSSGRRETGPDGQKLGRKPPRPLDFSNDPNLPLLTENEKLLCSTVRVKPAAYLTIKKQILVEFLRRKGKLSRRDCRTLFKMDVNKLGKIYDCIREEGFLDSVGKFGLAGATIDPVPNGNSHSNGSVNGSANGNAIGGNGASGNGLTNGLSPTANTTLPSEAHSTNLLDSRPKNGAWRPAATIA